MPPRKKKKDDEYPPHEEHLKTINAKQDEAASKEVAAVRVSVAQKKAVLEVLERAASYASPDDLAKAVASAVVTAEDDKTRWTVVTWQPVSKELTVYGPYATVSAATKALESGACSYTPGTRGVLQPLVPSPKRAPTKKAK